MAPETVTQLEPELLNCPTLYFAQVLWFPSHQQKFTPSNKNILSLLNVDSPHPHEASHRQVLEKLKKQRGLKKVIIISQEK